MRRAILWTLLLSAISGCTSAEVYTVTGAEPYRPDRIAVTGRLCTEDTAGSKFPVKVLIMVDTTIPLATADPDGYRFCGGGSACAPGSIERLIARNRNAQNVSFGFAGMGSVARPVVPTTICNPLPCDGQQYFPARDIDVDLVQAGLSVPQGSRPDVENAISQAESFITADMARSSAGEILRTRYIVYMFFGTAPRNNPAPEDLGGDVVRLKEFVYSRGGLEFRLNTGLLYFGERTIDGGTNPYNCYQQGGGTTPCACGGSCASDSGGYCGVCCTMQPGGAAAAYETSYQRSQDAYKAMAFAGDGLFREFQCAPTIDFQIDSATTAVRLVRKDIIAYNLNVRLATSGPVLDSDGDGLTDVDENNATPQTDPLNWDTDGDGINDRLEFRAWPSQDPTNPRDRPQACGDLVNLGQIPDRDVDLLNDCEEGLLQTNGSIPDTDGDGLPDALEFFSGTVPTSAEDRLLDFDGDGIINAQEVIEHTNPRTNDGDQRGAEGYRSTISDLGRRTIANMEDSSEMRAVSFRSASPNLAGGAGYLNWNAGTQELEWCDANINAIPAWQPEAVPIDNGTDEYTLYCSNPATGEEVSIIVFVVEPWLPDVDTTVNPFISTSERNCYDVRISNIKLMQSAPAVGQLHVGSTHELGTNHILIFFTQAPEDRLDAPGISKVAELKVTFQCADPDIVETCARNPADGFVEITDTQFRSSVP